MTEAEIRRAVDFVHAMEERSYTRTEPWRWGRAFLHEDFPVKWALNFLRVESDEPDVDAATIAEEAHRIQGGAGLRHRKIRVDDQALGERLVPGFRELGWMQERLLFMALRNPPAERPAIEVVEMTREELFQARMEVEMNEQHNSAEDARMLTESRVVTEHATNLRNLVGLIDGETAGWGELYSDGRTAQIEDIGTLERFRNRGVARAVILGAVDLIRAEGHDFFFLIADADDWPKALYEKLGFEPIGETYEFLLRSK